MALISRVRIPWLLAGVLFHLGVAFFMGLVTFSMIMIGLELFLISDSDYRRIQDEWRITYTLWSRRWIRVTARRQVA